MKKIKAAVTAAVFATLTSVQAVQADDVEKQAKETAKLCADLAKTESAITNFRSLSKDSTVEEAQKAHKRVSSAIDDLGKSAKKPRPQQYEELKAAREQLKESMKDIPKDATLGQVQARIQSSTQRLSDAYQDLEQSVTCP